MLGRLVLMVGEVETGGAMKQVGPPVPSRKLGPPPYGAVVGIGGLNMVQL